MRKTLIAVLLIATQTSYAQDCITRAANKPSTLVRFPDVVIKPSDGSKPAFTTAKVNPQLSQAETWVKGILKNFPGAKQAYSNDYFFDFTGGLTENFYKATGFKGYYTAKMRFYAYYCYDNRNEIFTEGESGSFVSVTFNNVFANGLCKEMGVYTINGKYAFEIFEKNHTEGRIDYYEQVSKSNGADSIYKIKNEFILFRNSDLPVFISITRKEYLEQLLKDVEVFKKQEIAAAKTDYNPANETANKAQLDAELKRLDNSKNYTPEQKAPYRKRLIETWETEKQKFDKRMARIEMETNGAREMLLEYTRKPAEWLNRTFGHFYPYSSYTGSSIKKYCDDLDVFWSTREEETRTQIVSINPAYYNKSLSSDTPQLIIVHLARGSYPHMKKVAELVKKQGALTPVENIFRPGKQTGVQTLSK
jgi:hypothetical protein